MPPGVDYKPRLPRLTALDPTLQPPQISRSKIMSADIPVYWGPRQGAEEILGLGNPPGEWPAEGTLLRMPRVARMFFETTVVDRYVTIAAAFTGAYDFGVHTGSFDIDITGPGSTPGSIHTTHPVDNGTPHYSVKFSYTIEGEEAGYVATGGQTDWYSTNYIPSFLLGDYQNRDSAIYGAIKFIWEVLRDGFIPAATFVVPGLPDQTWTPDGPYSVGLCREVFTGAYQVDGEDYASEKDTTTLGMTIPAGWDQPDFPQSPTQAEAVLAIAEAQYEASKDTSGPDPVYFDWYDRTTAMDDFLNLCVPIRPGFLGTRTVIFLMFSRDHPLPSPDDPRIALIRAVYGGFARYRVVILIDMDSFDDLFLAASVNAPDWTAAYSAFLAGLRSLATSLGDCGWSAEEVGYKDQAGTMAVMRRHMDQLGDDTPADT